MSNKVLLILMGLVLVLVIGKWLAMRKAVSVAAVDLVDETVNNKS